MVQVAINGFGRIGRLLFRSLWDSATDIEITHVNELVGGAETAAYLLKYDSTHGTWAGKEVEALKDGSGFTVDGKLITFSASPVLEGFPWGEKCDIMCCCTGKFLSKANLQPYLDAGVKRVVVSAPVKEEGVLNVVMGCNDHLLTAEHVISTAASCTTNCLAPVVKVVLEKFGIKHAAFTTIHNVTGTQPLVDMPMTKKKDLRRCRSGMQNLAPTSTGSATAIAKIFPELAGRINGLAVRVPMLNGSITDVVFELETLTTVEEANGFFEAASKEGELKGILGFETKELVSTDYTNDPRSGIVDAACTQVTDGTCLKVYIWYDNEWGYSVRMGELVAKVAQL